MANKIFYGITNVYYSKITETLGSNGQYTESYRTPVRLIGARAISLPAQNENVNFPADNNPYYWRQSIINGYEGTLTMAVIDDTFRKDILGETVNNTDNTLLEKTTDTPVPFALLFQFEGDDKATRHLLYRCIAGKPEISSQTRDTTISPGEIAIPISAGGRLSDNLLKAKAEESTTKYSGWFSAVYTPTV